MVFNLKFLQLVLFYNHHLNQKQQRVFYIFQQAFSDITENYGVMVINNRIHSKNITDKVFWYRAKEVPEFKLGCHKFIKYHISYLFP